MKASRHRSGAVAFLALASLVCFPSLILADSDRAETSFVNAIRSDRPSAGFRAFLEIRNDDRRALNVVDVTPGGPADRAGLRVGDLIVALDGRELPCWNHDLDRVKELDQRYSAGDAISVSYYRPAEAAAGRAEKDVRGTILRLEAMAAEMQEELLRWVAIAEKRLTDGETLYCHDLRPSESRSHHVCHDDTETPE